MHKTAYVASLRDCAGDLIPFVAEKRHIVVRLWTLGDRARVGENIGFILSVRHARNCERRVGVAQLARVEVLEANDVTPFRARVAEK